MREGREVNTVSTSRAPTTKLLYRGEVGPWSKEWCGWLLGRGGGGQIPDTSGGLCGTGHRALNISNVGLIMETPDKGHSAWGSCGSGNCGCGNGGTNTSVGGNAGGRDVGTEKGTSATMICCWLISHFHCSVIT